MAEPGIVLAMLACLTSGLAAVVVAPGNRAGHALLVAGAGVTAVELLAPLLPHAPATASGGVLVQLQNIAFFAADVALTALLALFPRGRFERSWHRTAVLVVVGVAAAAEVALVAVAPRMSVDGSGAGGATHPNPFAIPALAPASPVADVLWTSTLAWPLVGVVILVDRLRRADRATRRELLPPAVGVAVLTVLLLAQLAASAAGADPGPGFAVAFQLALAALPVVLLAGIAARTRMLDRELAASRLRLVTAEDAARRGIERDLHDGVQQQLVAILSLTHLARRQQGRDPTAAATTLDDVAAQVAGAIGGLRELVSGIRPPVLTDAGVGAALASRLEKLPAEVTLDVAADGSARWSDAVEAAAYFAGCEAVTNALKHAPGSAVRVRVVDTDTELAVEVTDTGPGMPEGPGEGTGLSGLRDRVRSLGGELRVLSPASGGTTVVARFERPRP